MGTSQVPADNMFAFQVQDWADGPKLIQIPKPSTPTESGIKQIKVLAVGIHNVVRGRATNKHLNAGVLPHIPGLDGTGIDIETGKPVYFFWMKGTLAQYINMPAQAVFELPDGVDPILAAALMNPVTSSWMALKDRLDRDRLGSEWSVLINGATTASGRLAVKVSKALGAARIIGAARSLNKLQNVDGLDAHVVLASKPSETDFTPAASVSAVLDYLWGPWPSQYLASTAGKSQRPVTWISVGSLAGETAPEDQAIRSVQLRLRDITIRGAGPGSWTMDSLMKETGDILHVLKGIDTTEGLELFKIKKIGLEKAEQDYVWTGDLGDNRLVITL